jgi:hypothetical protein
VDHNHPDSNPSKVCLLGFQCDEVFPTCSHCKCTDSDCSLSNQHPSPLSNAVGKKLNLDDMKLLHNWTSRSRITFSDHSATESLQQGDHEIKVGLQNPYGTYYSLTRYPELSSRRIQECSIRSPSSLWCSEWLRS